MNSVTGSKIVETGVEEILAGEQAAALVVETLAEEDLVEILAVEVAETLEEDLAETLAAVAAVEILAVAAAVEIFNKRNETSKDNSKAFGVVLACFVSLIGVYHESSV